MRYSISTYTLFHLPIDKAIEQLIEDGWKAIELMGEGEHHGRILLNMEERRLNELANLAKSNHVSFGFHLPVAGFNPASADEETEMIWRKCLFITEILDVDYVLFHPGTNDSIQDGISSTALFAKQMLKKLPEQTRLVIENVPDMKNGIGVSIEQLISIIHNINNDRVGMMLDTGHCYMNEGERFLAACETAFPYLYGLHINDNHGEHDEHLQIGEGTIPFQPLFLKLGKRDLQYVLETNTTERAKISKLKMIHFFHEHKISGET